MDVPDPISAAVRAALDSNLASIEDQLRAAIEAVRGLPDAGTEVYRDFFLRYAVQAILHSERGKLNNDIRRAMTRKAVRPSAGPPKVVVLASAGVQRVAAESLFNLMIGGFRLGDLQGTQLDEIATRERHVADGHRDRALLLEWCRRQGVGDTETVRTRIPHDALKNAYLRISRGESPDAAGAA